MKKYSELEIMKSVRFIDEDLMYFLTLDKEDKWLGSEVTLKKLKEQRNLGELDHSFTAIIDDLFYVADKSIISVWRENTSGSLQYSDVIYWHEVDKHPFNDLPIFICHTDLTHDIDTFHDKMLLIFAMYEASSDLFTPFDHSFEDRQLWKLDCEDDFDRRDFEGLIKKLRDIIEPILFDAHPSYMNVQRLAENEVKKRRLLEQQFIAQNLTADTGSE